MTNRPLSSNRFEVGFLILGWLLIAILIVALSKQNLCMPGFYNDEAVSGGLARDFVTGQPHSHMSNVQLAHSLEYSLLSHDLLYLHAARSDHHAEIQPYSDKQGQIVFYTIRFREQ